jgi:hypothetical protein
MFVLPDKDVSLRLREMATRTEGGNLLKRCCPRYQPVFGLRATAAV